MGPQPVGRGEWEYLKAVEAGLSLASMGPQPVGRGETVPIPMEVVDHGTASMGPQPVGRGELMRGLPTLPISDLRFNGATASRPWRGGHPCTG